MYEVEKKRVTRKTRRGGDCAGDINVTKQKPPPTTKTLPSAEIRNEERKTAVVPGVMTEKQERNVRRVQKG